MKLTTRGRYAVTALLDLAIQTRKNQGAVSLSDIAKRQSISVSYLEQLFSKLRKKGIVSSTRGAAGGYQLAKPLNDIDVMTIITAVDESVNATQCGGAGDCQGGAMCLTHDLWFALSIHIEQYLKNVTLAQLLEMENVQTVSERQRILSIANSNNDELDNNLDVVLESNDTCITAAKESQSVKTNQSTKLTNDISIKTINLPSNNEVHPV